MAYGSTLAYSSDHYSAVYILVRVPFLCDIANRSEVAF